MKAWQKTFAYGIQMKHYIPMYFYNLFASGSVFCLPLQKKHIPVWALA